MEENDKIVKNQNHIFRIPRSNKVK